MCVAGGRLNNSFVFEEWHQLRGNLIFIWSQTKLAMYTPTPGIQLVIDSDCQGMVVPTYYRIDVFATDVG